MVRGLFSSAVGGVSHCRSITKESNVANRFVTLEEVMATSDEICREIIEKNKLSELDANTLLLVTRLWLGGCIKPTYKGE
jgi:hypothetical protein